MAVEVAQVLLDANNITTIISNINSLYDNLITYSIGVLALVGGVVPFIINRIQNRSFKDEQEAFLIKINNDLEVKKEDIKISVREELKSFVLEESTKLETELVQKINTLEKSLKIAQGASFHVQANQDTNPASKMKSCKTALGYYLEGEDERNVRSILHIIETNIDKLNKTHYESMSEPFENLKEIIQFLIDNNINGRYALNITLLKKKVRDAENREAKV